MSTQTFEKIEEFLDKQTKRNKDGRMKISSMCNFIESIEMEGEIFEEIDNYLQRRDAKSKYGYMTISGIRTFIKKLKEIQEDEN